jgi:N-dimethylarginine dimethylaminohydrolase
MPVQVLLADPAAFTVAAAQNPHMRDASGELQRVDPEEARDQWEGLLAAFQEAGLECHVLAADPALPDLVFTANPSLLLPPKPGSEETEAWLSRMAHRSRRPEVALHASFFRGRGYGTHAFPEEAGPVEGHGDLLHHPGRPKVHVGLGSRSSAAAWDHLARRRPDWGFEAYILDDPRFYHLDTALAPLDETHALLVPSAFQRGDLDRLQRAFPDHLLLKEEESLRFAGNAWCPDRRHVFLQAGLPRVEDWLAARGFLPVPVETGEFLKSGGSVFCLKQAF